MKFQLIWDYILKSSFAVVLSESAVNSMQNFLLLNKCYTYVRRRFFVALPAQKNTCYEVKRLSSKLKFLLQLFVARTHFLLDKVRMFLFFPQCVQYVRMSAFFLQRSQRKRMYGVQTNKLDIKLEYLVGKNRKEKSFHLAFLSPNGQETISLFLKLNFL